MNIITIIFQVRNLLEYGHTPVNFRSSPPLEAFKPHRHSSNYYQSAQLYQTNIQRTTTKPLVLTQNGRKNESIKLTCDNSPTISMDVRPTISPPAKLFHCAVSPRRRQLKHSFQRQRPHRPCLDFDKMQQVHLVFFLCYVAKFCDPWHITLQKTKF